VKTCANLILELAQNWRNQVVTIIQFRLRKTIGAIGAPNGVSNRRTTGANDNLTARELAEGQKMIFVQRQDGGATRSIIEHFSPAHCAELRDIRRQIHWLSYN
jgi:hypothetical protein